ncbi:MAG: substrate-binding domain-containing protein, partial [Ruthenibacterium sp.]
SMNQFWALAPEKRPTAVIATNYDLTKGAIVAVREHNIRIPRDLSFVGYDFEDLAVLYTPQLSIIVEPMQSIGERVVDVLCKKMNGQIDLHSKGIYRVEPTLVKYGSVKRI